MKTNLSVLFTKKWFLPLFFISVFLSGIIVSVSGLAIYHKFINKSSNSTINSFAKATPAPINKNNPEEGIYNALLLGYGGGNHEGTLLTDSIIVIHVNTNTKKASLISVPRDLWVNGNQKVNAVGVNNFKDAMPVITNVTGLPINYFVAIDFSQFEKLVDNLGGVTVTMPNTLDDPFYPIIGKENDTCGLNDAQIFDLKNKYGQTGFELEKQFTCRYEHLQYTKDQVYNIDGATALKISRSRHGDNDFGRSLRQFAILQAISQKLISLKSLNKLDQTVSALFNMVKTDLDLGTIKSLAQVFGEPGAYKINQIQLTSDNVLRDTVEPNGAYALTPKAGNLNFTEVKNYIKSQINQ